MLDTAFKRSFELDILNVVAKVGNRRLENEKKR